MKSSMKLKRIYNYEKRYVIIGIMKKEKKEMYVVKLMNEFIHGILWVCDEEGISTNYDLIDKDLELIKLNEETRELFDSYYEFDSHNQNCLFNEELEKKTKDKMLELIRKIKNRLSKINDGTFIVVDCETEKLERL